MDKVNHSIRYKENPFINTKIIPLRDKQVSLGRDNNVLINQVTGETSATHIVSFRKVDSEKFVKLFAQNIGLTFDLSSFGIKTFNVLLWVVQNQAISKDTVVLDKFTLEEFCLINQRKFDIANFRRGLRELESAEILAKTMRRGSYFINPHFCFNGDRMAFTTVIENKDRLRHKKDPHTIDFLESMTDEVNN